MVTLTPLDTFAKIAGIHPLHFRQVQVADLALPCGRVWLQHDWQGPTQISRESVSQALYSAEIQLEEFLGYPIKPKWFEGYLIPVPGYNANHELFYEGGVHWPHTTSEIIFPRAYFITGGQRTQDVETLGALIVYTDTDSDGYFETATVTIATSVTDVSEIAIYYPDETDEEWRITPKLVKITGGTATITLNRYDLVLKNELEALRPSAIDGTDDSKFLDTVDVYRVWNDPSVQGILRACNYCTRGCAKCQFSEDTACFRAIDNKSGIVEVNPATWDADNLVFKENKCYNKLPYTVETWFKAGWNGENIWEQAVCYLALGQLHAGLCECPSVLERLNWWTEDLSKADRTGFHRIPITGQHANWIWECPWGFTRGAIYAYSLAIKHKMPQGAIG